jgi:hypothetical protein
MNWKHLTGLALATALTAGCNSGSRDSSKAYFGPGSTGSAAAATSAAGGVTPGGGGASVGQFAASASLNEARFQHTATVLTDGRVLVVGGTNGQGLITESELFDPQASAWSLVSALVTNQADGYLIDATGQFATVRQLHQATKMNDGRVLVTGGFGAERLDANQQPVGEMLKGAWLFDPASNAFSKVADMPENRGWHEAAVLSNGQVIVTGGMDQNVAASLISSAAYDSGANAWTSAQMASKHTWGAALTCGNTTLVVGGVDATGGQQGLQITGLPAPRVELFNAQSGAWQNGNDNADHVFNMGKATDSQGKGFLAGGQGVDQASGQVKILDTIEVFDNVAGTWSTNAAKLTTPRFSCEASEISTASDMLICGGVDASGMPLASCELWSVLYNTILGTVNMSKERVDFKAVKLNDGRVMVIGGQDATQTALDTTEIHTR